jgi:hypothetical protein
MRLEPGQNLGSGGLPQEDCLLPIFGALDHFEMAPADFQEGGQEADQLAVGLAVHGGRSECHLQLGLVAEQEPGLLGNGLDADREQAVRRAGGQPAWQPPRSLIGFGAGPVFLLGHYIMSVVCSGGSLGSVSLLIEVSARSWQVNSQGHLLAEYLPRVVDSLLAAVLPETPIPVQLVFFDPCEQSFAQLQVEEATPALRGRVTQLLQDRLKHSYHNYRAPKSLPPKGKTEPDSEPEVPPLCKLLADISEGLRTASPGLVFIIGTYLDFFEHVHFWAGPFRDRLAFVVLRVSYLYEQVSAATIL